MLLLKELYQNGYDPVWEQVETADAMGIALARRTWDVVISSDSLPSFSVPEAFKILQQFESDLPFMILCGLHEEVAIAMMQAGASDYFVKGNLRRLAPAITRELHSAAIRREKRQLEKTLSQIEHIQDEFVSCLNHELQTPIASLQGSIELLLTGNLGDLSDRGKRMLEIAANNTDRLVRLTDTMLNFEQFAAKHPTLLR